MFQITFAGPWGLPVIGDVTHLDLLSAKEVQRLTKKYGKVFRWVCGDPTTKFLRWICRYMSLHRFMQLYLLL